MGTIEAIAQIPGFYSREGLHTQIYDVFAAEQTGSDIPFWLWCAQTFEGPVLEAACGTGRVSWAIADAGFEVVGLDVSEPMIDRAGAKEGDHPGARASFVVGDMTSFDLRRKFALIVVPFRAFQALLTVQAQRAALACFRRHLMQGGHLVLDLFDPRLESLIPGGRPDVTMSFPHPERPSKVHIETTNRQLDPVAQIFTEIWRFSEIDADGRVVREESEKLSLRWLYRYETMHLLEACGFEVVAEYSDFDRSPPAYGNEQLWVARA